jgi:L-aspartate oxidase
MPALFPNVVTALRSAGIDPEHELVPVAPAAHYMMGGIATDLVARATLPALYAVGECSCTGLHGANRLASNSLTECFVFGARAARAAVGEPAPAGLGDADPRPGEKPPPLSAASREALWRRAGLERNGAGLRTLTTDPHPLVRLIAESALAREETRGAHLRTDFPQRDSQLDGHHVLVRRGAAPILDKWV